MITVYGKPDCTDWARSKAVLESMGLTYRFLDIASDFEAGKRAENISGGQSSPVIVFPDGGFVVEPSDEELTAKLNR